MNPRNAMTAPIIQPRRFPPFPQSRNTESIASLWSSMNLRTTFSKSNGGSPSSPLSSRAKILRSPDGTLALVTHPRAPPSRYGELHQGGINGIEGIVESTEAEPARSWVHVETDGPPPSAGVERRHTRPKSTDFLDMQD